MPYDVISKIIFFKNAVRFPWEVRSAVRKEKPPGGGNRPSASAPSWRLAPGRGACSASILGRGPPKPYAPAWASGVASTRSIPATGYKKKTAWRRFFQFGGGGNRPTSLGFLPWLFGPPAALPVLPCTGPRCPRSSNRGATGTRLRFDSRHGV